MKKILLTACLLISAFAVSAQRNTSQSYIEQFKDNAIRIMHESGIPASIILAIAMHESANGNSAIAKNLNNQFGVKGGGTSTYVKNKKKVRSAYKQYASVLDSFQDFARIMTQRKQFSHLAAELTQYDYAAWVHGIQHSGYASSKKWGADVLSIIEKYKLNSYDGKRDTVELAQNPQ